MIRPDAIPVVPAGASVTLDAAGMAALFGRGYTLRGAEQVALARLGRVAGPAAVSSGAPRVAVDAATAERLGGLDGVRLVGPCGSLAASGVALVAPHLRLPAGLRRAWGVPDEATVALGLVALSLAVEEGPEASLRVDRALWLACGQPATARWLPGVNWAADPSVTEASERDASITVVARRVVTETDVRQARLRGRRIRLAPGQVVTPAAQSLAREWSVFERDGATTDGAGARRR